MGASAYAEYTVVPAAKVHIVPSELAPGIAAAAILQGLTALTLIREAYHVQRDDWILVHAAAGGVGLWLCQLLRVVGAKVIATASSAEKLELAKENGATVGINNKEEDIVKRVLEITGGEGVHAAYDSVGKDTFDGDLEVVRRKGTVVSFGNAVSSFQISHPSFIIHSPSSNPRMSTDPNPSLVWSSSPLRNLQTRRQESKGSSSNTLWIHSHPRRIREVYLGTL